MDRQEFIAWMRQTIPVTDAGTISSGNYYNFANEVWLIETIMWGETKATVGTGYIRLYSAKPLWTTGVLVAPVGDNVSGYSAGGYQFTDYRSDPNPPLLFGTPNAGSNGRLYVYGNVEVSALHVRRIGIQVATALYDIPTGDL